MIWVNISNLERSNGRIEVRDYAIATRLEQQCQGCQYAKSWVLSDEIHQWLVDRGESNYCFALNQDTWSYQVLLSSSQMAMLFKLTWV